MGGKIASSLPQFDRGERKKDLGRLSGPTAMVAVPGGMSSQEPHQCFGRCPLRAVDVTTIASHKLLLYLQPQGTLHILTSPHLAFTHL